VHIQYGIDTIIRSHLLIYYIWLLTDDEWQQSGSAPPTPPRRDRQSAVASGSLRHRGPTGIERAQKIIITGSKVSEATAAGLGKWVRILR